MGITLTRYADIKNGVLNVYTMDTCLHTNTYNTYTYIYIYIYMGVPWVISLSILRHEVSHQAIVYGEL